MNANEIIPGVPLAIRAETLTSRIKFLEYTFVVREGHGGTFLQATYMDIDVNTRLSERQHTRKWLLSPQATDSEIVQTAFKLCLTSMEHRCREGFLFDGERVYSPHYDVLDLVALCRAGRSDAGGRKTIDETAGH